MWFERANYTHGRFGHGPRIFKLESRRGVAVCRLLARVSSLQGMNVCLPDRACLMLGPGALKLHGVTFQGAKSFTG